MYKCGDCAHLEVCKYTDAGDGRCQRPQFFRDKRLIYINLTTEEIDNLIQGLCARISDYCYDEIEEEPYRILIEKLEKAEASYGAKEAKQ